MKIDSRIRSYFNYIPLISSITNSIDLFKKYQINKLSAEEIKEDRNFTVLKDKSVGRCIVGLVPVLGNIALGLWDLVERKAALKEYETALETVQEDGLKLGNLDSKWSSDPTIVKAAIEKSPEAIRFADKEMVAKHPHIAKLAIEQQPHLIQHLDEGIALYLIGILPSWLWKEDSTPLDKDTFQKLPARVQKELALLDTGYFAKAKDEIAKEIVLDQHNVFLKNLDENSALKIIEEENKRKEDDNFQYKLKNIKKEDFEKLSKNVQEALEKHNWEAFSYGKERPLSTQIPQEEALRIIKGHRDRYNNMSKEEFESYSPTIQKQLIQSNSALIDHVAYKDFLKIGHLPRQEVLLNKNSKNQIEDINKHPEQLKEAHSDVQLQMLIDKPELLPHASMDVALRFVEADPEHLKHANKKVAWAVLEKNGLYFLHLSDELKKDPSLCKVAIRQNYLARFYVDLSLFYQDVANLIPKEFSNESVLKLRSEGWEESEKEKVEDLTYYLAKARREYAEEYLKS